MKNFLKNIMIKILKFLSKKTLKKHKPFIIGITGNIGKTSTKDAVYSIIKGSFHTRASEKSFNSEVGVPLTILGEKNPWNNLFKWSVLVLKHLFKIYFFSPSKYPKVLVLEIGADKPKDIEWLTSFVTPNVTILTPFQKNPVHSENFLNREDHLQEKNYLVKALDKNTGILLIPKGDADMERLAEKSGVAKKYFYGYHAEHLKLLKTDIKTEGETLVGMEIDWKYLNGEIKTENILGVIGEGVGLSICAGILTAKVMDVKDETISAGIQKIEYPKSRLTILKGQGETTFIDDTYNASPKAYETLMKSAENLKIKNIGGKKIGFFGSMGELGSSSREAHMHVAEAASKIFDVLVFVGVHTEYFLGGASVGHFPKESLYMARNADEAITIFREMFKNEVVSKGDVVYFKGSQSVRMEKVVRAFIADTEDASKICRSEREWLIR